MRKTSLFETLVMVLAAGAVAAAGVAGCAGSDDATGQSDFDNPAPSGGTGPGGGNDSGKTGGAAPGAGGAGGSAAPRTVEEGDIVKVDGSYLYVLNQYRGLQVVDMANPDQPTLVSRVPLYGSPLEMYVRDGNVYALVSDYWTYWRCADCAGGAGSFHGSQVAVIDVSNPRAARLRGKIDVEGIITDSRVVGDVLYTVSNRYAWWYWGDKTDDTKDLTFVQSINIADPEKPVAVDRLDFPREGWENHIHVTDRLMYVASSTYGRWDGMGECAAKTGTIDACSRLTAVDISSPVGRIAEGTTAYVRGFIQDRWAMDWYDGVMRILTGQGWSTGQAPQVHTFKAPDALHLDPIATTSIVVPNAEGVTATRFDGPRAFVVTFYRVDPLWTIDLSDPAKPFVAGHLQQPGWLDFIEPRGDRLVALGHDRDGDTGPWSLQVSLYDVSDLSKPSMIARRPFGEGWGWVPGSSDDYRKVFKVVDDAGMVLVPFQSWVPDKNESGDEWGGHYQGGVQILDFGHDSLEKRGFVEHPGWVERAVPQGNRILTVSNELVQAIDITDRDNPKLTGSVELARNVTDIALGSGGDAVELAGDWYKGDTKLYVVPTADPNTTTPEAVMRIPAPYGRIYRGAGNAYVLSSDYRTGATRIDVVQIDGGVKRRGSVALPFVASYWWYGGYYWDWWGGGIGGATQVGPSTLVLHRWRNYGYGLPGGGGGVSGGGVAPGGGAGGSATEGLTRAAVAQAELPEADFYVVDLSNPDQPKLASTVTIPGAAWVNGAGSDGNILYVDHYEVAGKDAYGNPNLVKYYLDRIDLSDPAAPHNLGKVNVPGAFLAASGTTVYTADPRWDGTTQKTSVTVSALTLSPTLNKAFLKSAITFSGQSVGSLAIDNLVASTVVDGQLTLVDLRDPKNLRVASQTPIPGVQQHSSGGYAYYDWSWVRTAASGHVFLQVNAGILVYDVSAPDKPLLGEYVRTDGWVQEIRVGGGQAFMPTGYYGVETVKL